MLENLPKRVLPEPRAAEYLGISSKTLKRRFKDGTGPRFVMIGSNRRGYRICDLDAWVDELAVNREPQHG